MVTLGTRTPKEIVVPKLKPKTLDVAKYNNELYIKVGDCGIPTLLLLICGMNMYWFKGDGAWLKVTELRDWFKKQLKKAVDSKREMKIYKNGVETLTRLIKIS